MASATAPNSLFLFSSSSSSSSHHRPSFHVASSPRLHVGRLRFAPSAVSASQAFPSTHFSPSTPPPDFVQRRPWHRFDGEEERWRSDCGGFEGVDLNVPLDENQHITDDTRVRAAIPTIKHLIGNGARVILSSHLGRPKGVTPKYSLKPLVPRLSELLGVRADDCIGPEVETMVAGLPEGGVLLLENVRFYKEEEKNEPEFCKLASFTCKPICE
ncbi:phosphoglycerate kinase, chloroplastic-like protein [Cinnamomum micranthum f. kanehirae]|uniref:Phosphoglycerate kinase n=1 Tax=Cinnamomum micranthum f. kanehirae TaxID=337451 RepID=A0A443P231_9MAGN|nr:phosphoglycerate kinase, chloroplastic-like protein [Cinnamomum micranthum f. kanehirae]